MSAPAAADPAPSRVAVSGRAARLILVGVGGYGRVHAERIAGLRTTGAVDLVAAVDPILDIPPVTIAGTPMYPDLPQALAATGPVDVVVIAAPIAEHVRLAELALDAGADVYLEKPPVAAYEDFLRLLATERRTGRAVQVGFQSLGSHGPRLLREDAFGLGEIVQVGATGAWSRSVGYWSRSPWAGRRNLAGQPVVDGVVTNPLAHATATALAVAGCEEADDVVSVDTDLYRANAIDSDDTSVVRIHTASGKTVTGAFTLCAAAQQEPMIHIRGTRGRADYSYTTDRLDLILDGQARSVTVEREDLLENLLAFQRGEVPLLVPLSSTGAFMRVLDAVARAGEPVRVDPRAVSWTGEDAARTPVIPGIEDALRQAAETDSTFTELGLSWTYGGRDAVVARAQVGEHEVLAYRDGAGTIPSSSPRPYLHPVRTLGGVVVTATHPADHDWHTGVGMAIPDVNGSNFWGGGTYRPGRGYAWGDDHGVVRGGPVQLDPAGFRQQLEWVGAGGRLELVEQRAVSWTAHSPQAWRLTFSGSLTADHPVRLGSPGSLGRAGSGYGGFFWRFPRCADVDVFTPVARGEEEVHGTVAPWVAWSADFGAGPGASGPATIIVSSVDAAAEGEPWIVSVSEYPGLGSALAWDHAVDLAPGRPLTRRFEILVADGRLDADAVADALASPTR
jgi:predicted dehydrogenase